MMLIIQCGYMVRKNNEIPIEFPTHLQKCGLLA